MADDRAPFEPLRAEAPEFVTVEDYEAVAREKLPGSTYDYIAGGAGDEWTLERNRRAFERWMLRPRFLRGAGRPDTTATVMGTRVAFPVLVAPWAYQRLVAPAGELATRRATSAAGTVMVVSSTALDILEEVALAAPDPAWWQLYVFSDRGATSEMLARVRAAGYGALVWTVDFPVNGLRHRDTRNGFVMPIGVDPEGLVYDPELSWDDLAWIRDHAAGLPVVVKGLLTAEDAVLAVEHGADGVVVSNHGGRQLDGVPGGLDALGEVVDAIHGRIPVLMDGGVRRGIDVLKALGLGAQAVLIGRPVAWGLAAAGEDGVAGVLRIIREEVSNAMALTGCRTVSDIRPELVVPVPGSG
jgi:isopentenyl diphosphate isomerase/L-lactate dehydrogenase-like FMN-dependent dehydrogenase